MFGLLTETEVNEIQEYCLHVTESQSNASDASDASDAIQYSVHNMETVYDISYYSNMVDIHIDDECSVSVNTFQLNALLDLCNRFLAESASQAPLSESVAAATVSPVTQKFNINSVALSVKSVSFTYYMLGSLIPSYQRPVDSSIPYAGEDKERSPPPSYSQYAIP